MKTIKYARLHVLKLLILSSLVLIGCSKEPDPVEYGTISDNEGNVYKTVRIGTQNWMAENIKATRYNNGDEIGTTLLPNTDISSEITPKYQWEVDNPDTYGRLYTWYTVTDSRGICPIGWHVPTDTDWQKLIRVSGGEYGSPQKLMDVTHWSEILKATNETGFSALPGVDRHATGRTYSTIQRAYFWSISGYCCSVGHYSGILSTPASCNVILTTCDKSSGLSLRCVRD